MARVELDVETSLSPERVRDAFLDFSEGRPEIWPSLEPSLYEVYSVGESSAEVREGSRMPGTTIWARELYDWSTPGTIRWTVRESNFCASGSYVAATLVPLEGVGTRVHVEWERTGTSLLGRLLIRMIALSRGRPIATSLRQALEQQARGTEPASAA